MTVEIRKPTPSEIAESSTWAIWTHEPASFEWGYSSVETCLILEGEAMVEAMGKEFSFGPGDWVVFPKGLACRWNIRKAIKKHYKFG